MTTRGFSDKFLKSFIVISIIVAVIFVVRYGEYSAQTIIGQYMRAAIYSLAPCVIIALIWEGLSPKEED